MQALQPRGRWSQPRVSGGSRVAAAGPWHRPPQRPSPPCTIIALPAPSPTCACGVDGGRVASGAGANDADFGAQLLHRHGCCCGDQAVK